MHAEDTIFAFGPFRLHPGRHLLSKAGRPVPIGSRALELLIALLDNAGELVTKDALVAQAWPNSVVEESSLRAQIAALKKVLRDGRDNLPYIVAVPGRGYRFVAAASRLKDSSAPVPKAVTATNLPCRLTPVIGRADTISVLKTRLQRCRFVTVVGPGGVGKTTVAIATAEQALGSYRDGVCFVDPASIVKPELLPSVLASALGLYITSDKVLDDLAEHLRHKQVLLILDNCERIADAVARVSEHLLQAGPQVHVLATSREPLRAEGESVYRLATLDSPPAAAGLSASHALTFPSVQLFVERAAARVDGFTLQDADAPVVADICRQLDGIALAIELAAGRVDAFGLRGIAERLEDRFRLLRGGRRTALPRHQTLTATLDWSYDVLPDVEKFISRRLAVFAGSFSFDSAAAVAACDQVTSADMVDGMANLVARSLVVAEVDRPTARYRLLESTRAYALGRLIESGENSTVSRNHAAHYTELFERALNQWEQRDSAVWLEEYAPEIDNLRAALEWAYSPDGDATLGSVLTLAAIPLWFQVSATEECRVCVQRALSRLDSPSDHDAHARQIMQLYGALGLSRAFTLGMAPQAKAAWHKALEIAEQLGDREYQRESLWGLWLCQLGDGDYRAALSTAKDFNELAEAQPDILISNRLIGAPLHCLGEHTSARRYLEQVVDAPISVETFSGVRFRFGQPMTARVFLAQMLWLQGLPDQAMRAARLSVDEVSATGHAISLSDALAQAMCPIALYVGDYQAAEESIAALLALAQQHALGPWAILGRCWQAVLHIRRNQRDVGIPLLSTNLELLREARFAFYRTQFMGVLAEGMAADGEVGEGLSMIEQAIDRCGVKEELWCLAEMLRLKGTLLVLAEGPSSAAAETVIRESLQQARMRGAMSWELRAAMSLSDLQRGVGLMEEAKVSIATVYDRFTEGFSTADLQAAKARMDALRLPL